MLRAQGVSHTIPTLRPKYLLFYATWTLGVFGTAYVVVYVVVPLFLRHAHMGAYIEEPL